MQGRKCPHCGSPKFYKHQLTIYGTQTYICHSCKKTKTYKTEVAYAK